MSHGRELAREESSVCLYQGPGSSHMTTHQRLYADVCWGTVRFAWERRAASKGGV
jgi:hypothetical protein